MLWQCKRTASSVSYTHLDVYKRQADRLTESIVRGTSYDMLEAHYGILPISKSNFYRRKGTAQRLIRQRMAHLVEEKNGQYMICLLYTSENEAIARIKYRMHTVEQVEMCIRDRYRCYLP